MRAAPGRLDGVSCEERRAPQLAWEQPIIQGLPSWLGRPPRRHRQAPRRLPGLGREAKHKL